MNPPGKQIKFNADATDKIKAGVDKLAQAIKITLGPKGRHVALGNPFGGPPTITKDGVSVAREVSLKDLFENAGAQLVKEVAQKTADDAGDGTTTATILAQAIFTEGLYLIRAGANPMFVKRGIEEATKVAITKIREMSKSISADDLFAVATIAANGDEVLGRLIADAMKEAGLDGVITVEESKTFETSKEGVEGVEINRGYLSPYFINNSNLTCELENCYIFLTDQTITNVKLIVSILTKVAQQGKPILFIAPNVEGNALITLIQNKMQGTLKCCAIKAPYFGDNQRETLEDIAAVTGGKFLSKDLGMDFEHITLTELGRATRVVVTKDICTIIDGEGEKEDIQQRINYIKQQLETVDSDFEREKMQERLARLTGGVIILNIGAATETEMKEKKARVEDALHATRAAIEEGIVPGGGITYLHASSAVETLKNSTTQGKDIEAGYRIVQKALQAPLFQICENAGLTPEIIFERIKEGRGDDVAYGYDIVKDVYGNLFTMGVTDPTKVAVSALQNAASVAGMLLTLEVVIVDEPVEETNQNTGGPPMPMGPGMPGMM